MAEERIRRHVGVAAYPQLSWSAIFGGTFFAFGIILILSMLGLAVGAGAAGPQGATQSIQTWAGIWSQVTVFLGFFLGGWLATRASGQIKAGGRIHGLVTWGLGSTAIFYFAVTSTSRVAAIVGITANMSAANLTPGLMENVTVTAAVWTLLATICGLMGGILGGHAGGYQPTAAEITAMPETRQAA